MQSAAVVPRHEYNGCGHYEIRGKVSDDGNVIEFFAGTMSEFSVPVKNDLQDLSFLWRAKTVATKVLWRRGTDGHDQISLKSIERAIFDPLERKKLPTIKKIDSVCPKNT